MVKYGGQLLQINEKSDHLDFMKMKTSPFSKIQKKLKKKINNCKVCTRHTLNVHPDSHKLVFEIADLARYFIRRTWKAVFKNIFNIISHQGNRGKAQQNNIASTEGEHQKLAKQSGGSGMWMIELAKHSLPTRTLQCTSHYQMLCDNFVQSHTSPQGGICKYMSPRKKNTCF